MSTTATTDETAVWLQAAQQLFETAVRERLDREFVDLGPLLYTRLGSSIKRFGGPFDSTRQALAPLLLSPFKRDDFVLPITTLANGLAADFVTWCQRFNFAGRMPWIVIESTQAGELDWPKKALWITYGRAQDKKGTP